MVIIEHRIPNQQICKWLLEWWTITRIKACFTYGPLDPCAGVNILDIIDSSTQHVNFVDFTNFA